MRQIGLACRSFTLFHYLFLGHFCDGHTLHNVGRQTYHVPDRNYRMMQVKHCCRLMLINKPEGNQVVIKVLGMRKERGLTRHASCIDKFHTSETVTVYLMFLGGSLIIWKI